jgi:2'-5' RNA ligase
MESYKDYMFILSPPWHIGQQIKKFKQSGARLIGDFDGMHSKAYITLKSLRRQKPFFTEPLLIKLEKELSLMEPTTLQIDGFATFLSTDFTTIYAVIKSTPAMEDWFKRLRKCLTETKTVPHITIARQVPDNKAKMLWPKFKDRLWSEQFTVSRLTVLYRETFGHSKTWEVFREISFKGDPELNKYVDKKKEKEKAGIKPVNENQISLF